MLCQVKTARGLTWKELLLSIKSKQTAESLNESACGDETPNPSPEQTDSIKKGVPQVVNSSSSSPVAAANNNQRQSQESSRLAGDPPKEACARCRGKPQFDEILEEWVCGTCGGILRFQQKSP